MAAFHFSAKVHSRSTGASAVCAAAYRSASRLDDERLGRVCDYTRKNDVVETAILVPEGAPAWTHDRTRLWNAVEAFEKRRDAQLAQEYEINLPREFSDDENWRLITDFARERLVATGRICDIAFHKGEASDGQAHPHAHILMPTRVLDGDTFGAKHPDMDWRNFRQQGERLQELRQDWCDFARKRAAELGIDLGPEWDARSLADRGLDLEPQPKIGQTAQRLTAEGSATERTAELLEVQRRNGERLLRDPGIALQALTRQQSTFSEHDLARWVHRHTAEDQFGHVFAAAREQAAPVGTDGRGQTRYSTQEMLDIERRMIDTAEAMAATASHPVRSGFADRILDVSALSDEQQTAARALLSGGDLTCLLGYAGAGKSTMLGEVRRMLELQGYTVRGAALSGIAAENLEEGSGIEARTLASWTHAWERDRDQLTSRDVLVIDEAGMIGSRQLSAVLEKAHIVGSKVILVGDPEQLQAIEAGAAFRAIAERTGAAELTEIRRQQPDWQRAATKELATGRTADALARYQSAGSVTAFATTDEARAALVDKWATAQQAAPEQAQIMLAHTRADVAALNELARSARRDAGQIDGADTAFETSRGRRDFAEGDRLLFLRNDRGLGVRNGTLATVEQAGEGRLVVRADDGREVTIDASAYRDFDHGYAVTVHKAQGVTVDRAYVLATGGFDRHLSYVAMSRHREGVEMVYSREDFKDDGALAATLGRERSKDTTLDYGAGLAIVRDLEPVPSSIEPRQVEPDWQKRHAELLALRQGEARKALRPTAMRSLGDEDSLALD